VTLTYTKSQTYQELNYFFNALKLITVPVAAIYFLGTFNFLMLVTSTWWAPSKEITEIKSIFRKASESGLRKVWRERKSTRCNNQIFIINFCLNMFRAALCPSSEEQRPCYCIRCTELVLLDVVVSGCGALRCRMRAVLASYSAAPHNR